MSLSKKMTFEEYLVSIDIKGIGKKTAEELASRIKNIATFRYHIEAGTISDVLLDIKGIGESTKDEILEKVHNFDFLITLEDMENENYDMFKDSKVYMLEELIEVKLPTTYRSGGFCFINYALIY